LCASACVLSASIAWGRGQHLESRSNCKLQEVKF
jgi:hypothetical protein